MKNEQMIQLLKDNGIDVSKYPSLTKQWNQSHENYKIGGENDGRGLAVNSKFYNEIMKDGYVFNPYIHRRWLPTQYLRTRGMALYFFPVRILELLSNEVDSLVKMSKYDSIGFYERSKFFTIDFCKEITNEFLEKVKCNIGSWYFRFFDEYKIEKCINSLQNTQSYTEVQKILTYLLSCSIGFNYVTIVADPFIEVYRKAGAYYTLKHLIMFTNKKFPEDADSKTSLNKLSNNYINCSWKQLDSMIDTLEY